MPRPEILEGCTGVVKCNVSMSRITDSDAGKMRCGSVYLEIPGIEGDKIGFRPDLVNNL
jgi:hypothetical protein